MDWEIQTRQSFRQSDFRIEEQNCCLVKLTTRKISTVLVVILT
jgi:hypothetical protein